VRRKYSKTCGFDYEMHRETVSNVFVDACGGFGKLGKCAGACMIDSVVLVGMPFARGLQVGGLVM
jgi:hypothetical protein